MGSRAVSASVLARAQQVADDFAAFTGVTVDATELITGRAALLNLTAPGHGGRGHAPVSSRRRLVRSDAVTTRRCRRGARPVGSPYRRGRSVARPDGTRAGSPAFFDWMNSGKRSYTVYFDKPAELAALLDIADVVIEASRPAARARRGLGPHTVTARPGRVWLRITGHGAQGERAGWVAFGDDAAVSGGLVGYRCSAQVFTGGAIADALTGLHAAGAVVAALSRGGGELIQFAVAAVAAEYAGLPADANVIPAVPPSLFPTGPALGADNASVRQLVAQRAGTSC